MATYTSAHTGAEIDLAVGNANLMLLTGAADPDITTVGTLGQLYQNTTDGTLFRCSAVGATYTWVELADYSTTTAVNTLTETAAGKVLDARQGKTLSDKIGTQTFTEDNYVTDGQSATASIDALDMAVKDNADLISTNRTIINEKTSYGVYTGLVVAQQTSADMTVKCSAGTIYMKNGDRFAINAVASIAITAADATNPRIDIVYVASNGAVSYLAGTAKANPSVPGTPAGGILLSQISVGAEVTTIVTANIVDNRKFFGAGVWIIPTLTGNWVSEPTDPVMYRKNEFGVVEFRGRIKDGTLGVEALAMPAGYRRSVNVLFPYISGILNISPTVRVLGIGTYLYILTKDATTNVADLSTIRYAANA